jgi:OmpR-family two-component system manganese-sensing sensor histidine kinase
MFQATRQRLALWYTLVTAVLLLLFASGFYLYVRSTLVERIDDTLNHVVEVVQRSLIVEPIEPNLAEGALSSLHVNLEASFPQNAEAVEDDHIDLEWFSPAGDLLWSTFSAPLNIPLHPSDGETVYGELLNSVDNQDDQNVSDPPTEQYIPLSFALRQVTREVRFDHETIGFLRVSHPWFEVTKPSRQLIRDLSLGTALMVGVVAAIGWFLSGLAIAPVRDSYQRLKQFTADASHELRNPIAVIQTNVQVALADPDPQLQQDQLKVIERLTRRLGRLVDDLLFLARQDSGITPLRRDAVKLDELLHEVIEEQQMMAADKALSLKLNSDSSNASSMNSSGQPRSGQSNSDSYVLHGDRDQLIRLFTNLISNAIQYTPEAGQIQVLLQRTKQQGMTQLQVQIKDSGIGIPPESLPRIFERFYRVDPARSNLRSASGQVGTGSGLGLAIASVIVDNHHGQIQVESHLNQGTLFTIWLPIHGES